MPMDDYLTITRSGLFSHFRVVMPDSNPANANFLFQGQHGEDQVMQDPFLSSNALIEAELSYSQEHSDQSLIDLCEAILDDSIGGDEFSSEFECPNNSHDSAMHLSSDSITADSTEDSSTSESSVPLSNDGLDVEEIDQNSFQVLFKSLRSRPIFYQELFGERTRTNCQAESGLKRARCATVGPKFPYSCTHCDHVFKYFTLFEQHLKSHNLCGGSLEFYCNLCSFVATNKSKLKRHVLSKH